MRFPKVAQANYQKFRNPASRYAIVGVFVAKTPAGVRVAVTGAGPCVFRVSDDGGGARPQFQPRTRSRTSRSRGRAELGHPRQRRVPRPSRQCDGAAGRRGLRLGQRPPAGRGGISRRRDRSRLSRASTRAVLLLRGGLLSAGLVLAPAQAAVAADGKSCRAVLDQPIALENANGLPLVTVQADGAPLKLILDTGAERTVLTSGAVERVGGRAPQIEFRRSLNGVGGSLPSREVEFKSFKIGGIELPWRRAMVATVATPSLLSTVDGVLGTDVLGRFDIDLDLPNHRMSLYEKGACTPEWAGADAEIKIGRSAANSHLFFPVQLDNRRIIATIDTGAQRTTLSVATASAMGITDAVLARDAPIQTRGFGTARLSRASIASTAWRWGMSG